MITPEHTYATSMRAGVRRVRSIRSCAIAHKRPPIRKVRKSERYGDIGSPFLELPTHTAFECRWMIGAIPLIVLPCKSDDGDIRAPVDKNRTSFKSPASSFGKI